MALNLDAIGKKIGPVVKTYDWRDVVLYALGVGAGFDELEYCYENRLKVIPSFSIGAVFDFLAQVGVNSGADLTGILHGEQDIIFYNPIPPEGKLITEGAITHFYDKGKETGALVVAEADTFHSNGQKLFTNIFTLFCRRDGGFGGPDAPKEPVEFPDRPPDFEEEATPSPNQPLIYRLSGDIFALHVDPDFAKASGFEKPIMHGLCTHGFACRAVIKHLFPGEPERMRRFRNRFSKTLYPGTPIKTQIWKLRDGYALFRTINALTGEITIDRGIVEWETGSVAHVRPQRDELRFDDRVAVITGAGRGLGRVYALELAKRGAKVVVNDFGGARNGSGEGAASPADSVVEEIKVLGGQAIANYDSVSTEEGGRRIIDAAMEAFGHLDILINNAGILRDKSFLKLEPADWDAVRAVHLDGAYYVTRAAFNHMRNNKYGRIVFTTSAAGLYGNFGQTNYSAAKMGLVGLMNSLKLEGDKHGIKVNAIAPIATTRLTEDILPPDLAEKMKPELIAPLTMVLCSDRCPSNGSIYGAGMGRYFRIALVTGRSISLNDGSGILSPETIAANFANIIDMRAPVEYGSATEALGDMLQALQERAEGSEAGAQGLTVQQVFEKMPEVFQKDKAAGVNVVFQYDITGPGGGKWFAQISNGECLVRQGSHEAPTTTIVMADEDFLKLVAGSLNAMQAYTSGKLKIQGDIMKSQLIEKLFKFSL
jgi:NAD(P)-dependent dehydrogenase (short-subunit alcohol dehydrogenase family)/acyl dehydratase/putative sterol carrier protein|uniref:SDR family NAD(P)-dependent oxidoreductase n=1 Tax=Desulfomonile tiedjei TaxID=2358 RepID=A0A7C4ER40_9BACT